MTITEMQHHWLPPLQTPEKLAVGRQYADGVIWSILRYSFYETVIYHFWGEMIISYDYTDMLIANGMK